MSKEVNAMNKAIKEKLQILLFVVIVFGGVFIWREISKSREKAIVNAILDNVSYAVGKIDMVQYTRHDNKYDTHNHVKLGYSYQINGVWYNATTKYDYVGGYNLEGVFLDKQIIIIYCKSDVEKRRVLITYEEYEKFGLPFPSYRQWICNYIEGIGRLLE